MHEIESIVYYAHHKPNDKSRSIQQAGKEAIFGGLRGSFIILNFVMSFRLLISAVWSKQKPTEALD